MIPLEWASGFRTETVRTIERVAGGYRLKDDAGRMATIGDPPREVPDGAGRSIKIGESGRVEPTVLDGKLVIRVLFSDAGRVSSGALSGRIIDEAGGPIDGVHVGLGFHIREGNRGGGVFPDDKEHQATTDRNGQFLVLAIPRLDVTGNPTSLSLVVRKEGFASLQTTVFSFHPAKDDTPHTLAPIRLEPGVARAGPWSIPMADRSKASGSSLMVALPCGASSPARTRRGSSRSATCPRAWSSSLSSTVRRRRPANTWRTASMTASRSSFVHGPDTRKGRRPGYSYPYGEGITLQLRSAISHLNEAWAVETGGIILSSFADELPWEWLHDSARWTYDEARHCQMGYERLLAWGLEPAEIPLGTYIYDSTAKQDPIFRLGMLYFFETKNIGHKRERAQLFHTYGDAVSEHDMDFDWADETMHASYGRRWLSQLLVVEDRTLPPTKQFGSAAANSSPKW